ncbi:MAG: sialidase family protein [Acidobacteriota bacterium]
MSLFLESAPIARRPLLVLSALWLTAAAPPEAIDGSTPEPQSPSADRTIREGPEETPDDPYVFVPAASRVTSPGLRVVLGRHTSVQVNVDDLGMNIVGDAANEPSIAIDPNDRRRIAIGWRQFDTITSNFRQAGVGTSDDGGATWSTDVIEPGVFRSDPVLDWNADGTFFYNSLNGGLRCEVFRSGDAGVTWDSGVSAFGGDKQWMVIDRTEGAGAGHIYAAWWPAGGCCFPNMLTRSRDAGASYETPVEVGDGLRRGTLSVGADGAVYAAGHHPDDLGRIQVGKSINAGTDTVPATFDQVVDVPLGGPIVRAAGPNPGGLLGQIGVFADPSDADRVYVLSSVDPPGTDPLDIYFARSTDGGVTWDPPVRINDDPTDNGAWQWFGTLSVAPSGRIDALWADSRADPDGFDSVIYHAFSVDAGVTWSANEPLTPPFDPQLGYPNQSKIGDYYESISFDDAVHLAYAATFNGEQDVYHLHFTPLDALFRDGFESGDLAGWSATSP